MKVLLADSSGYLGGAASNNLIYPFMQYFTSVPESDGTRSKFYLSRGIFLELVRELKENDSDKSDQHFLVRKN